MNDDGGRGGEKEKGTKEQEEEAAAITADVRATAGHLPTVCQAPFSAVTYTHSCTLTTP